MFPREKTKISKNIIAFLHFFEWFDARVLVCEYSCLNVDPKSIEQFFDCLTSANSLNLFLFSFFQYERWFSNQFNLIYWTNAQPKLFNWVFFVWFMFISRAETHIRQIVWKMLRRNKKFKRTNEAQKQWNIIDYWLRSTVEWIIVK